MFLLGFFLALFLIIASIALGGWEKLVIFWDTPSVLWVLLGVLLHVFIWGRSYFRTGLTAILRSPQTGDPAIADYFRRLTVWTVGVGVVGMIVGAVWGMIYNDPEEIGTAIALSLLTFFYAGCLAMMVFAPISVLYSKGTASKQDRLFPVSLTLLGLAAYFLTRAIMVILLVALMSDVETWKTRFPAAPIPADAQDPGFVFRKAVFTLNPTDLYSSVSDYLYPQMYWDTPTLLFLVGCLYAFRLSSRKPRNRFDWIPVSIIYGVLGSVLGMVLMLCDLDPDLYSMGCMVSLLSALYGLVAALFFAIGSWRLVWLFFLGMIVAVMTWFIPFITMSTWDKGYTPLGTFLILAWFFLWYDGFLGAFLYLLWGGIKKLREKRPQPTEPMNVDEEQAQRILDSAVKQQKPE